MGDATAFFPPDRETRPRRSFDLLPNDGENEVGDVDFDDELPLLLRPDDALDAPRLILQTLSLSLALATSIALYIGLSLGKPVITSKHELSALCSLL